MVEVEAEEEKVGTEAEKEKVGTEAEEEKVGTEATEQDEEEERWLAAVEEGNIEKVHQEDAELRLFLLNCQGQGSFLNSELSCAIVTIFVSVLSS